MTVKDMKEIINNLPDNTEIEINSVWDEDIQSLTPTGCSGFYHEALKKVCLTPDVIELPHDDFKEDEEND